MKIWEHLKAVLFRNDAEDIHDLSVRGLILLGNFGPRLLEMISATSELPVRDSIQFLGKNLPSPVGLAAGFDKNAVLVPYLPQLGFSFAEVGSVTLRPQSGNPKPRLFRGDEVLFNRMGFNNDGAEAIARRLSGYDIPANFSLGINLGLNKEVAHANAAEEYLETYKTLSSFGDYFVVNLSSPNTPGLRDLQQLKDIEQIFAVLKASPDTKPIFLKLAPELDDAIKNSIYEHGELLGIDGFVLTNTLKGERAGQVGGWSGAGLTEISRRALGQARKKTRLPVISVGGIMTSEEAVKRKRLGANLVQIYTGWIFNGPRFPNEIRDAWFKQ